MRCSLHQPSQERMLAYAAGAMSAPEAVVMATYLSLQPHQDAWVRKLQSVGGRLLEGLEPEPLEEGALERVLARAEVDAGQALAPAHRNEMNELPEPLRSYPLGPWRWLGFGMRARDVHAPREGDCRVILLEIGPGRETPKHTHGGVELTCVLRGAYATETARYDVGDFEEADEDVLHQPRVVSEGACLCVVALDGQIQLDGLMGRLIQPFVRI